MLWDLINDWKYALSSAIKANIEKLAERYLSKDDLTSFYYQIKH